MLLCNVGKALCKILYAAELLCCCCCLRVMIRAEARSSVRVSSAIPLFLLSSPAYCELLKSFHSTIYPSSAPRSRTFSRNSVDLFSPQSPYASIARCLRFCTQQLSAGSQVEAKTNVAVIGSRPKH